MGNPFQLQAALNHLRTRFAKIGLRINLGKCELWGPGAGAVHKWCPDIPVVPWESKSGVTIQGCPVA